MKPAPENKRELRSDLVNYQGKQWGRRGLGAFLNLVVFPGSGSFILGRTLEGGIQVFLASAGLAMKMAGGVALVKRVGGEIGGLDTSGGTPDPGALTLQVAESIQFSPPSVIGVNSLWMIAGGLSLFVVAWIFSLVSCLLPTRGKALG